MRNDLKVIPLLSDWRMLYRYTVYKRRIVPENQQIYKRSMIVITNRYNKIVKFTNLHRYVINYESSTIKPITSDISQKLHYICNMLNYILIQHHRTNKIDHVFDISHEMLEDFFGEYAMTLKKNGDHLSNQSVEKCIYTVTSFFNKLSNNFSDKMAIKKENLYKEVDYLNQYGVIKTKKVPNFSIEVMDTLTNTIFRNLTSKCFNILLPLSMQHTPDISLAICLGGFGGIRPGEICNTRQAHSPLGSGLKFKYIATELQSVKVDLTKELKLRSDGKNVGSIKKKRSQDIYKPYLPIFETVYKRHMEFLNTHNYEKDYCPLFINSKGMAMTYGDFRYRFTKLVKEYLCPVLINNSDPELRILGQILQTENLGPHALRHYFTVQLVLNGEDIASIQKWRGDNKPETAIWYYRNKSDLIKQERIMAEKLFDTNVNGGGLILENERIHKKRFEE